MSNKKRTILTFEVDSEMYENMHKIAKKKDIIRLSHIPARFETLQEALERAKK